MKVTFLGTAAATAMPLPFCNCNICKEANKLKGKDLRKRASVVINDDLLIDLGPDSINACYQYGVDLSGIKYIVQTHAHSDHFDAGHMITRHPEYAAQNVNPVTLIASNKTLYAMNKMLKDEDESADLFSVDFLEKLKLTIKNISHSETISADDYSITALDSLHDINQQALIYLITCRDKTILYGTDLSEISEDVFNLFENKRIDILILDQTYGEGYNAGGHLDAGQLKIIINRLKQMGTITDTTHIFATHISHEGNDTHEKMQSLANEYNYDIAYDGLIIMI
jgi:phosphoribosyl 1,2-cyclic phosphate phosphodiesterase